MNVNASLEQSVFADLTDLEKSLAEDNSGERARALLTYFREVAQASEAILKTANSTERQLVTRLIEGFHAAQRIVRQLWETLHNAPLVA
jgi:hypothetical protein